MNGEKIENGSIKSNATNLIEISAYNVHVGGKCFEIVKRFFGAQIPSAQDVMDATGNKKFLEFGWQTATSMRNVQITKNEDELRFMSMVI